MNLPNFATMTNDELMAFWSRYSRPSRRDAKELLGHGRPGFTKVAETLANYACNVAVQRTCAERGDENAVAVYGYSVKLCFDSLPSDVQSAVQTQATV